MNPLRRKITSRGFDITIGILFIIFFTQLHPPSFLWVIEAARKNSAKAEMLQLCNALRVFREDYGYYPRIGADGFYETPELNACLVRTLCGNDPEKNPRNIHYLEVRLASETGKRGFDPETGAWNDPWGRPYRIRVRVNEVPISSPYSDDAPKEMVTDYIVWSVGEDGIQGRKNDPKTKKGSDDVVSWETR